MTTEIEEVSTFVVSCSRCERRESFLSFDDADIYANRHDWDHVIWRRNGETALIAGVWRGVRGGDRIDRTEAEARRRGLPFFEHNDRIYKVESIDMERPFCWARDIPGHPDYKEEIQ